jgi:hypothetical protein
MRSYIGAARKESGMLVASTGAILILCMAIGLFIGTVLVSLRAPSPSRVEEIRRLRQEGLATVHK